MWSDLEFGYQAAFEAAWRAYLGGTIPIGAAIVDEDGALVATGQNQVRCQGEGPIQLHQLAHAELNAILKISEMTDPNPHPGIRRYVLYTTMEPCPLCFGAIVMGHIRHVKYAARDGFAGATALCESIDYIKGKNIRIQGPYPEAENVQIALQACYEWDLHGRYNAVLECFEATCPAGAALGRRLARTRALAQWAQQALPISQVYDNLLGMLNPRMDDAAQ